jgi:ABC-type transport system involved in multi-copper enzyme maturation permease subunit
MSSILCIARNTFREIVRDRILYGILVGAVLLIMLSLALGQLSFTEQTRIAANFGFTAIHIGAIIVSIFVGSTLVGREIDKKTILTLFVRPISRQQFLIGKALGLMAVNIVCVMALSFVLMGILYFLNLPVNTAFWVGVYGILLEACLLLSAAIFFGSFASPMFSVSFTVGLFLIGHWVESLKFFTGRSESESFKLMGRGITLVLPNFEFFNWRSLFIYSDPVPWGGVVEGGVYMLAYFIIFITSAALILGRRDLG